MKRIQTNGISGNPHRTTKLRHYPIKKGTKILLADGTKIIKGDGSPFIVPESYCFDLGYDSSPEDEYIFWNGNRAKKINVLACQQIY